MDRGEPDLALERLNAAQALAAEQRLGFVREPRFIRGAALIAQGAVDVGVNCLREGLWQAIGRTLVRYQPQECRNFFKGAGDAI